MLHYLALSQLHRFASCSLAWSKPAGIDLRPFYNGLLGCAYASPHLYPHGHVFCDPSGSRHSPTTRHPLRFQHSPASPPLEMGRLFSILLHFQSSLLHARRHSRRKFISHYKVLDTFTISSFVHRTSKTISSTRRTGFCPALCNACL